MNDARLRLAYAGLLPGRVASLVRNREGSSRVVRAIDRGGIEVTDAARDAVWVSAAERRRELNEAGMSVVYRGEPGYPEHLARFADAPDVLFVRGALLTTLIETPRTCSLNFRTCQKMSFGSNGSWCRSTNRHDEGRCRPPCATPSRQGEHLDDPGTQSHGFSSTTS